MSWEQALCIWLPAMSLISFCAMGADKRRARKGAWRTPEKRLFLFAALGGAPGALLGMYVFHHKTKHWYFVVGFWALFLLQAAAAAYFLFF